MVVDIWYRTQQRAICDSYYLRVGVTEVFGIGSAETVTRPAGAPFKTVDVNSQAFRFKHLTADLLKVSSNPSNFLSMARSISSENLSIRCQPLLRDVPPYKGEVRLKFALKDGLQNQRNPTILFNCFSRDSAFDTRLLYGNEAIFVLKIKPFDHFFARFKV